MRNVLQVIRVRGPEFRELPGVGPVYVAAAGFYALTRAELVGPFSTEGEARRLGFLGTRARLPRGFRKFTRVVEI